MPKLPRFRFLSKEYTFTSPHYSQNGVNQCIRGILK